MPRAKALKATALPTEYIPDFADRLNRNFAVGRALRDRIETIETDLGGADTLTHARRSLVRRTVWLEAVLEHNEQRLAGGQAIDLGGHTQAINSLLGLYRLLGIERRLRPANALRDVMNGTAT